MSHIISPEFKMSDFQMLSSFEKHVITQFNIYPQLIPCECHDLYKMS